MQQDTIFIGKCALIIYRGSDAVDKERLLAYWFKNQNYIVVVFLLSISFWWFFIYSYSYNCYIFYFNSIEQEKIKQELYKNMLDKENSLKKEVTLLKAKNLSIY